MTAILYDLNVVRFMTAAEQDRVLELVIQVRHQTGDQLKSICCFCNGLVGPKHTFSPRDLVPRWRAAERAAGLPRRSVRWRNIAVARIVPEEGWSDEGAA